MDAVSLVITPVPATSPNSELLQLKEKKKKC